MFNLIMLALSLAVSSPPAVPATPPTARDTTPGGASARILVWDAVLPVDEKLNLRWPVAVAGGPNGELAVADADGYRVLVFANTTAGWEFSRTVDLPATPAALAHDGNRYLVSLRQPPWLLALEGPQQQIRSLPLPAGSVPGALAPLPTAGFLVQDLAGDRLLEVSPRGGVSVRAPLPPGAVAVAPAAGGFIALYPDQAQVRRFNDSGEELDLWPVPGVPPVPAWPAAVAAEPGGSMVIADRHGGRLVVLGAGGQVQGIGSRQGWAPGLLRFPAAIARLSDGRYAVADLGNSRVQIFHRVTADGAP